MRAPRYAKGVRTSRRVNFASRDSGSRRGFLADWSGPRVQTEARAQSERLLTQRRAADLAANDWLAESLISTLQYNVVGEGLTPNALVPHAELGISKEEAARLSQKFEWFFARWAERASLCGRRSFQEMQFLALRTLLSMGEIIHLPVMLSERERRLRGVPYALAVQAVSPLRLRTPASLERDSHVRDGIRFSEYGQPLAYYIAQPAGRGDAMVTDEESALDFLEVPARVGHRPGILHLFVAKEEEQVRGESIFSNSAHLFQYVDKAISYELEAQNMASKFAVFIAREQLITPPGVTEEQNEETGESELTIGVDGPELIFGRPGEEPKLIKSDRPSANWEKLINIAFSGIGGSASLSALAISKDFSGVNYSSARAAMNGDWKTYTWFRRFLGTHYCQPFFRAVIEEAYLRGEWAPPAGAPGFYEALDLWTSCAWIGPARGFMDPVKEIQADILAVDNKFMSRHEQMLAYGRDFDELYPVLLDEAEKMKALQPETAPEQAEDSAEPAPAKDSTQDDLDQDEPDQENTQEEAE